MAVGVSLQSPPHEFCRLRKSGGRTSQFKSTEMKSWRHLHLPTVLLSSRALQQDSWSLRLTDRIYRQQNHIPCRYHLFTCRCSVSPSISDGIPLVKNATLALSRSYTVLKESLLVSGSYYMLKESPVVMQLAPAIGVIAFAVWGLGPLMRYSRQLFFHRNDNNWKKSKTHYVFTSYLQPLLLWTGTTLVCRALNPVILPSSASQAVKQRLLNFVQSLSTVLAFAYCLTSLIQQAQKFFLEKSNSDDARNMGFQFAGKAVYTAVWIAAFSLFMELLGFSTQKWVTAGGLGTVLLTLAGREIFTNFLSSIMIHATRPFVLNEWIQAKIEGYEVSGTVEHVGWWSPTIIRGDDREAVHIPNHKFTVNVVRNLSQKTHWRIKTHLAISHLDVNKISNIVADMRKVLAKNPQIEQQRLHRRVFLENINPENQALFILVSCFVKTSHFEEYLCVKEAVLLDLLRVISHHRARLATPIRTVQKVYNDADMENIPFSDTIFTRASTAINRPLLLIEPPQRINSEDKAKLRKANEEQTTKGNGAPEPKPPGVASDAAQKTDAAKKTASTPEPKPNAITEEAIENISEKQQQKKPSSGDLRSKSGKGGGDSTTGLSSSSSPKSQPECNEREQADGLAPQTVKSESEKPAAPSPAARPLFEDNIVLGVALEGSKRTLPIEEGTPQPIEESKMAASRSGNGSSSPSSVKDRKGQSSTGDQSKQDTRS